MRVWKLTLVENDHRDKIKRSGRLCVSWVFVWSRDSEGSSRNSGSVTDCRSEEVRCVLNRKEEKRRRGAEVVYKCAGATENLRSVPSS